MRLESKISAQFNVISEDELVDLAGLSIGRT